MRLFLRRGIDSTTVKRTGGGEAGGGWSKVVKDRGYSWSFSSSKKKSNRAIEARDTA